jgi:urease accessory protein
LFSVTLVDGIILCRYLGNSVEHVKRHFIKAWQLLRLALRGQEAVIPRIWNT